MRRFASRRRWRFRSVMVDEFQDTNRLQCELVDLLGADELFFVGDEFQSIYRFRHADVGGLPRAARGERWRPRADAQLPLAARGARRRQPPLRQPSSAPTSSRWSQPAGSPSRSSGPASSCWSRTSRATGRGRRTGARPRRATSPGASASWSTRASATPGEVVLLFTAGTDAERYEEALREEGLPTHRAAGRGYFGQQQVVDLVAYLRLLHNRYDDEALVTVLASPLVGVSNDALVLLRRAAGRRPLFTGLERELPAELGQTRPAALRGVPPALRPARQGLCAARARAALRADRRRARLRPRRARPVGRAPSLREPAQARAARSLLRGAAGPGHRGLRPLPPRPGGGGRQGGRGGRRGGGGGRGAAPDRSTRPRGSSSRSSCSRMQGETRRPRLPTRSSAFPTGGSASASSTRQPASGARRSTMTR